MTVDDAIIELSRLIEAAGLRVTFDPGRNHRHPCHWCGASPVGAGVHELVQVGSYIIHTNGGVQPRDALTRPVCGACHNEMEVDRG